MRRIFRTIKPWAFIVSTGADIDTTISVVTVFAFTEVEARRAMQRQIDGRRIGVYQITSGPFPVQRTTTCTALGAIR